MVPAAYSAPGLLPAGRIALGQGWRYRVGPLAGGARPGLDDRGWRTVDLPATLLLPRAPKEERVRLRRSFTLPAGVDPVSLALDLGTRPGRTVAYLNGQPLGARQPPTAPVFVPGPLPFVRGVNVLAVEVVIARHHGGVRWQGEPALGQPTVLRRGLLQRSFVSEVDGSDQQLTVFVPDGCSLATRLPLVVALPGWNGNPFSFAHSALLAEAAQRCWLVLTPATRGNVLYTRQAEEGVLEALELVSRELPVDPTRVFLTGVSMGGAGALQIGYHFPDRFAAIAAFYGDSLYAMSTYVGRILGSVAEGERYSVLHFPANARNLPVLLIHARDDPVSPFAQSRLLADAAARLGLSDHRLIAPPRGGHTLQLVEDSLPAVVELFARSQRVGLPARVSFRTNHPRYDRAYWLRLSLRQTGRFGEVDLAYTADPPRLTVHRLDRGLAWARVDLARLGLGGVPELALVVEPPGAPGLQLSGLAAGVGLLELWPQGAREPAYRLQVEEGGVALPELAEGSWRAVLRKG